MQWQAEPWGGMEWERHGQVMHLLDTLLAVNVNRGLHPKHKDWGKRYVARRPVDFMPGDYYHETEAKPKQQQTGLDMLRKQFEG